MNRKRGFTLIELLVVIAIIGILSSVILVSLGRARNEAQDSRIISSMSQIRSLAEILYAEGGYDAASCSVVGQDCTCNNSEVELLCEDIYAYNQNADMVINIGGGEYCVQVTLNSGELFCVDSYGYAVQGSSADIACDSVDYDCDAND